MTKVDTLWAQFSKWRMAYTLLILALLVLAFCNGPRAAWAQQTGSGYGEKGVPYVNNHADRTPVKDTVRFCLEHGTYENWHGYENVVVQPRGPVILCDDATWIPKPCNQDAPYPSFAGDADKFVEFLLAHNADLLEHQEEPVRTALIEVIRSVGGMSYAVGYADGLKKGKK